jgi:hypothetical protein
MGSKRSTTSCAAAVLFIHGVATSVRAETTVHGTAGLTLEYNDNIGGVPDEVPPELDPLVADRVRAFSIQPTPGVALYHDSERVRLGVTYAHAFVFYIGHSEFDTSADIGNVLGIFELSPTEELTMGLVVTRYSTGLSTLQSANQTVVTAQTGGGSSVFATNLAQGYTKELSDEWSLLQTSGAGVSTPLGGDGLQPTTLVVSGGLGPQYEIIDHSFALLPSVSYTRPFYGEEPAVVEDAGFRSDDMFIVGGIGRWRWDWTEEWGSELSAGVMAPIGTDGDGTVAPVGSALIHFSQEGYGASLGYTRSLGPDLITGQIYYSDAIHLSGTVPIVPKIHLLAQASTGFSWNRVVTSEQDLDGIAAKTWVADVGVGWFPEIYPNIQIRYQRTHQFDAPTDQILLPNFQRNVVSLTVSYAYPPRTITTVPTKPPQRVDGADRDPFAPGGPGAKPIPRR